MLSGIFRGFLNTTLVQLMIFCLSFLYLGMSHYGLLANIFGGGLYYDLQDELIGWFLYGLGFRRGYFRADYSTVLIPEAAIAKCPFVFITSAMSYWWFFRLLACSLLKSSVVDVFITCFLHLFRRSVLR